MNKEETALDGPNALMNLLLKKKKQIERRQKKEDAMTKEDLVIYKLKQVREELKGPIHRLRLSAQRSEVYLAHFMEFKNVLETIDRVIEKAEAKKETITEAVGENN